MDFVHDQLARRFKCFTMTDLCSKVVPVIEVMPQSEGNECAVFWIDSLSDGHYRRSLTLDNGPEFSGTVLDAWAGQHRVRLHFIQPGKPVQNACDECLNEHWFLTFQEAQVVIEERSTVR